MRTAIAIYGLCLLLATPALAEPTDPCSLVTKAEIKEAVGTEVTGGTVNANNKAVCDYKLAGGSILNITLTNKGGADSAERMVAELKKRKIEAMVVPGLGDGAYASSPGYGMQQLGVYQGGKHIIVTGLITGAPEAKVKAILEKVLRKALARVK